MLKWLFDFCLLEQYVHYGTAPYLKETQIKSEIMDSQAKLDESKRKLDETQRKHDLGSSNSHITQEDIEKSQKKVMLSQMKLQESQRKLEKLIGSRGIQNEVDDSNGKTDDVDDKNKGDRAKDEAIGEFSEIQPELFLF